MRRDDRDNNGYNPQDNNGYYPPEDNYYQGDYNNYDQNNNYNDDYNGYNQNEEFNPPSVTTGRRVIKMDDTSPKTIHSSTKRSRTIPIKNISGKFKDSGRILLAFVFVLFMVYIGGYAYSFANAPVPTVSTVEYGSIDVPNVYTGLIIRDEVVYTATDEGTLTYEILDGDKVKVGTNVASIQDLETVENISDNLEKTRRAMMDLQEERGDLARYSDDVAVIENRIQEIVNNNVYSYATLDLTSLYKMKDDIENNINARNSLIFSDSDGSLSEMLGASKFYEEELDKNTSKVYTSESGVASFTVDGFESLLTPDMLDFLTEEQVKMTVEIPIVVYPRAVEEGDYIFKNVKSNTWYLAAYVDADDLIGYNKDMMKKVYLDYNNTTVEVEANIVQLIKGEEESFVVFSITKYMDKFIDNRNVTFKLEKYINDGYKIPNTAIISRTFYKIPKEFVEDSYVTLQSGTQIVDAVMGNSNQKVAVYLTAIADDEYVYTPIDNTSLRPNDVLVVPDDATQIFKVADVTSVTGIYMANKGIAEFVKISQDVKITDLDPAGFTILSTTENSEINFRDRIVTDATYITENQIIN